MISEFPPAIIYALVTSYHHDEHRDQGSLEKVGFTLAQEAWLLDGRQEAHILYPENKAERELETQGLLTHKAHASDTLSTEATPARPVQTAPAAQLHEP